nr:transglycosylase SLT domain-containing protein [Candidatus Blochmannia vafer]
MISPRLNNNQETLCFLKQQTNNYSNSKKQISLSETYDKHINYYSKLYGVDALLIKSIIQVESNYNPNVVSKSNAVGLMQIKADTAGKDIYRLKGRLGQPSVAELKNAVTNIELGTAYLYILQNQLADIMNLKTRRYAMIVAYVNGLGALLKIFSTLDHTQAIKKINKLNSKQFCQYIQYHHPSVQAYRYLFKVNSVYMLNNKNYAKH